MIIYPEIIITPDLPTIRFKQDKNQVDLDKELPKILQAQGWGCGTYFNIQFLSHDKDKLLSSALYVVTQDVEELKVNDDNPYQPVTRTAFSRKAEIMGAWHYFNEDKLIDAVIKWNPGKQVHEVKVDGNVVYSSADKKLAQQHAGV